MALAESVKAIMFMAPLLVFILLFATRSWIKPVVYLACIGTSIGINLGISSIQGKIRFISLAVVPILQLAVALDYAVFLSAAYTTARDEAAARGIVDGGAYAVRQALTSSFNSIFASASVGICAFAGLIAMDFWIGPDMGWVLVRGVAISYVTVITLLPAFMVMCDKAFLRTRRRRFMSSFAGASRVLVRLRVPLLAVLAIIVVPSFLGQRANSFIYETGESEPGSELAQSEERITEVFGDTGTLVVLVLRGQPGSERTLASEIGNLAGVSAVESYATDVGALPPEFVGSAADSFYSPDWVRITLSMALLKGSVMCSVHSQLAP